MQARPKWGNNNMCRNPPPLNVCPQIPTFKSAFIKKNSGGCPQNPTLKNDPPLENKNTLLKT